MLTIILFGKPGAGKGTQAEFLKEKYNLTHISTGNVFRENIQNNTELGVLAKQYIDNGQLVPDAVTIDMLKSEVLKAKDTSGFLFDGFPRTIEQAKALDELLSNLSLSLTATIALEADDDILVARILERGKTSGRSDDQDEVKIRARYSEYNEKTAPLIDFYKNKNKYYAVNGMGEIPEITQRLNDVIEKL